MTKQKDILMDLVKRVEIVKYQLDKAYLKYKLIGIALHPDDNRDLLDTTLAHTVFGTNFSTLSGLFVRVDPNVKKGRIELIMELPKN